MRTHRRTFPGRPADIRQARHWTVSLLTGDPRSDDVALIVAELSANAVQHTASSDQDGTFHVALTVVDEVLIISVTDAGTAKSVPHIDCPTADDQRGRGLAIVTALADHVEVRGDAQGRTVVARLLQRSAVGITTR